ncbi:MAG: hypothetical protein HY043_19520 [Verrucomicrobia bacterium]|nr:hypothetical protein [Verrucomicrobiota bacterium]
MIGRLAFILITAFWLVMNVLLWRSEFSGKKVGSAIPAISVWQKILSAPDDSSLEIWRRGQRIGRCRWVATVRDETTAAQPTLNEFEPEGQVRQPAGYTIEFDGTTMLPEAENRLRLNLHAEFSPNHKWREVTLHGAVKPNAWELKSVATEEALAINVEDEEGKWERRFTFAELRDPRTVLRELGAPAMLELLVAQMPLPKPGALALGLQWEARNDWLRIGHADVRVYRLQARLLDRYQAVVIVSRVGEILRVELPDEIVLVNEALGF